MGYQFERSKIERCDGCDFFYGGVDGMSYEYGYCTRHEDIIDGHKLPQDNDCPLVAISKTETTSVRALSCWYCTEMEKHGVVAVKTVLDKAGRKLDAYETPYNFCPNCGRRLEETP